MLEIKKNEINTKEQGALVLDLRGNNRLILNWANNMIEVWNNKQKLYCIDLNSSHNVGDQEKNK